MENKEFVRLPRFSEFREMLNESEWESYKPSKSSDKDFYKFMEKQIEKLEGDVEFTEGDSKEGRKILARVKNVKPIDSDEFDTKEEDEEGDTIMVYSDIYELDGNKYLVIRSPFDPITIYRKK